MISISHCLCYNVNIFPLHENLVPLHFPSSTDKKSRRKRAEIVQVNMAFNKFYLSEKSPVHAKHFIQIIFLKQSSVIMLTMKIC
jgi:hypothetical protein